MKMLTKILARSAAIALAVASVAPAVAATITYTLTGTGSARIGNVSEAGAFTATGIGDTANVGFPFGAGVPTVTLSSFAITFGANTYTATNAIRYFTNNNVSIAGFNDIVTQDVLDFTTGAFSAYNSVSNFGPSPVTFTFASVLATNGGALNWTVNPSALTFRAVVGAPGAIPEPGSWALMIVGFGLAGAGLRRQRISVSYA